MMTFGSLFSGIGGIDIGLERAGMVCKWQVEIDSYCQKVLEKHWPNVKRYSDVKEVGKHNLEPVDLICGGFPCQPHSYAGKRMASNDERDLWDEFYRIICEIKPRWVVAENVPGLLSSENGQFFGRILRDLAASGYDAEWQSIPAAAFGAPHIRERVFIVAHNPSVGNGRVSVSARGSLEKGTDTDRICTDVSDADRPGLERKITKGIIGGKQGLPSKCDWWSVEPDVGRVANGIPNRVDRLKGLGNAVVPQVAEWIGKCIIQAKIWYRDRLVSDSDTEGK
jgi:DNA (cytosine-5)-methyltransferase 1